MDTYLKFKKKNRQLEMPGTLCEKRTCFRKEKQREIRTILLSLVDYMAY